MKTGRPTPATVISLLALFIALGGTASGLAGKNTVFSDDIKNGEVKTLDINNDAVSGPKIMPGALTGNHVAPGAINGSHITNNTITSEELAPNSIGDEELAPGSITPEKISPETPAASVTHSVDQSIPFSSLVTLAFNTEKFDTAGLHAASPNSCLTPPIDGYYDIVASIVWEAKTNGYRYMRIVRNDTDVLAEANAEAVEESGQNTTLDATTGVPLDAGDCVKVQVFQTTFDNSGPAPVPAALSVKRETGSMGTSPVFSMSFRVPGP